MGFKYAVSAVSSTADTSKGSMAAFTTAAGVVAEFTELMMTGSGTDAAVDVQCTATWDFSDGSIIAAGAALTPIPFNQNAPASKFTSILIDMDAVTIEGTTLIAPPAITYGFNSRGGMRWAVPRGEGLDLNNSDANEDASFQADASGTMAVDLHVHWWEP